MTVMANGVYWLTNFSPQAKKLKRGKPNRKQVVSLISELTRTTPSSAEDIGLGIDILEDSLVKEVTPDETVQPYLVDTHVLEVIY